MEYHCARLYWSGRRATQATLAEAIYRYLAALGTLDERAGAWRFERARAPIAADAPERCHEALARSAARWSAGGAQHVSYQPMFVLGSATRPDATLLITCGVPQLEPRELFAPNRLELRVYPSLGPAGVRRALLEGALVAGAEHFRADWGHAGDRDAPRSVEPLVDDGAPEPGWLTFLSAAYPSAAAALEPPAVRRPVGSLGALIAAHPELYNGALPAHRAALERVAASLRASGVLVPAHRLAAAPAAREARSARPAPPPPVTT